MHQSFVTARPLVSLCRENNEICRSICFCNFFGSAECCRSQVKWRAVQPYLSHLLTKPTKWSVRPVKTRISLGICPVWSVFAVRSVVAKDPNFLHVDSEDSDQIGQIPRLIWVFAGHTCHFVGFVMRRLIYSKIFCPRAVVSYWQKYVHLVLVICSCPGTLPNIVF